jgi:hypothetical protein
MRVMAVGLVVGLVSFAHLGTARAALILDQQNVFSNTGIADSASSSIEYGQTFTTGIAGQLSQVDVFVFNISGGSDDLIFKLYNTSNGLPDTELGSPIHVPASSIPTNANSSYVSIDVSSLNVFANVGDVLAFGVSSNGGATLYYLDVLDPSSYNGGSSVWNFGSGWQLYPSSPSSQDYGFRTYVSAVPIPGTGFLFGSALFGLVGVSRRKKTA